MATYVNDLRLKEIATGDESGTWGTSTNTNLELIGEALGYGTEGITTNADTHATTVADGSTDPGRAMYIKYTGALDSDCTITIGPNTMSRMHFIENATTDSGSSGPYNIIISQGSGANVTIPNSHVKAVYLDGAGSGAAVTEAFTDLSVGGNLLIDGATPTLTIGDAGAEDTKIVFDGNAKDFYVGLDDSADKLVIGEGSTVGTNNILTITDDTVTIGDGAAADTAIVFDGNAQDFYIGLDDSADDLIIGLGSTVGTTPIISVDENKDVAIPDGSLTITTDDNTAQLTLTSTDADASAGPKLDLARDSGSPADDDILGKIRFLGDNDSGGQLTYADIEARIVDASNGSEDGRLELSTALAGSGSVSRIFMDATETIINNDSKDLDFRVESDANANMLVVDGGEDRVGVGISPSARLHVDGSEDYTGGIVISAGAQLHSWFLSSDLVNVHNVHSASASAAHTWQLSGTEVARITPSGLTFNGDTAAANALDDYETGAWTPDIKINDSTTGISYTARSADYVKIGKLVFVNGDIQLSDKGSSTGSVIIASLPFTVTDRTSATSIDGGSSLCAHSSGTSNLYTPIGLTGVGGATYINMYFAASSGATMASNLSDSKILDAFSIRFSLTYTTDS